MKNGSLENSSIIIIPAHRVNIYKKNIILNGWQWVFLGTDAIMRKTLIEKLWEVNRYYYAQELQDISTESKQNFLDWIAEIGDRQDKSFWWATNIAYKSPMLSDTFLNYCFLLLIRKWIRLGLTKKIIIIENPWLIKACLANFDNQGIHIRKEHFYFSKYFIRQHLISYAKAFLFLLRSIKMWITNKIYCFKYLRQIQGMIKKKIDILICTWIEDRSFKSKDGSFQDPYLGKIKYYYEHLGLKSVTITLPIFPVHLLKKVYESKEIIPSIYFSKFLDIFKSFFKPIFLKWNDDIPNSNGLNLSQLFKSAEIHEKGFLPYAFLQYRTIINLFKNFNVSCNTLLYPFENQPWEKMMLMGMQESRTDCKSIACHIIGIPKFYLNYFLGKNENKKLPQPDIIVSNGQYWAKVLENAGFISRIKNGGSFHFGSKIVSSGKEDRNRENNILVLLSTSLSYSLDLLFYLFRIPNDGKKFLLKPHPDTPEKIIRKYINKIPNNFIFIEGSINDWLGKVNCAIHVGTTAAIECLIHGISVFKYLPERIDLDPLLGMGLDQKIVTDRDTLNFRDRKTPLLLENNLIAEPINEEVWKEVLK